LEPDDARDYFFPDNYLFVSRSERAYSPEALNSGITSLLARLGQLGHPEARIVRQVAELPPEGGGARVHLEVDEGPVFRWRQVRYEWAPGASPVEAVSLPEARVPDGVYTRDLERDFAVEL